MPLFTDEFIRKVTDATDIVSLISAHTALTKKGSRYTGLCPFHSEKTPSFSVDAAKQLYYCFGCHEGGNAVKFVQTVYKYTFPEAILFLAERAGLQPEYAESERGAVPHGNYERNKIIYAINRDAANAYYKNFVKDKEAVEYVHSRGISNPTIRAFGLGLSFGSGRRMYDYLLKKGYKSEDIIAADIARSGEYGLSDTFRGRLMFPIQDIAGNIVGFGGRVMGDGQPKYLNTRENSVFIKNKLLFNLSRARKNMENGILFLVEGYMDVVGLYDKGIKNACASLGTAFGENHAALLKRYAADIIIAYDGDEAGQNASERAAEIFEKAGISPRILVLPPEHDPDSFVKTFGRDSFMQEAAKSAYATDYRLDRLKLKYGDLTDVNAKAQYLNEACAIVAALRDDFKKDHYANSLSVLTDIDIDVIRRNIEKGEKIAIAAVADNPDGADDGAANDPFFLQQAAVLKFLLAGRKNFDLFISAGGGESLFGGEALELYRAIKDAFDDKNTVDIYQELVYNNKIAQYLAAVSSCEAVALTADELSSYMKKLRIRVCETELANLKKQIETEQEKGSAEVGLLLKEYGYLKNMLLKLKAEVY